jgi:starch synthase
VKILMVASEAVPLAKTGGLGDMVGALAQELARLGHDLKLVLPGYKGVDDALKNPVTLDSIQVLGVAGSKEVGVLTGTLGDAGVSVLAIRYDPFFARPALYGEHGTDYPDNLARFALFCRAALEACHALAWYPEILHTHDWQGALAGVYAKTVYRGETPWAACRVLFTIHNIGYQGIFPATEYGMTGLPWSEFTPDRLEYFGQINILKGGIVYADVLNTVSPTYAQEIQTPEFGYGLEGVLHSRKDRLFGVTNGVDYQQWSPATDPYLPSRFTVKNMAGKKHCKVALQREMKLPARNVPVLGVVSRLVAQKGIDLLAETLPRLFDLDVQVVLLGSGDVAWEQTLTKLHEQFPQKFGLQLGFDEGLAHRIEAGADMFLMPSRYEPCGLNQLYSLAYGTIPIVRKTGGLADTVTAYRPATRQATATGFVFEAIHPESLFATILLGLQVYQDKPEWRRLMHRAMLQDHSWQHAAQEYVRLYKRALTVNGRASERPTDTFPRGRFR